MMPRLYRHVTLSLSSKPQIQALKPASLLSIDQKERLDWDRYGSQRYRRCECPKDVDKHKMSSGAGLVREIKVGMTLYASDNDGILRHLDETFRNLRKSEVVETGSVSR